MNNLVNYNQNSLQAHLKNLTDTRDIVLSFKQGRMQTTIDAYSQDLEHFRVFMNSSTVEDASRLLLEAMHGEANYLVMQFKAYLIDNGNAPNTVNRRLASLRSLVKFARTIGMINWSLDVPNMKAESYRDTTGPSIEGVRKMLDEAGNNNHMGKSFRDVAILRLLYDLALRRGEIVSLDYEDLDLPRDRVFVMGKGRTQKQALSLPEVTQKAIIDWLKYRGYYQGALFVNFDRSSKGKSERLSGRSIHRIVKRLGHDIGIDTRPHGLRHTAITEAVKSAQANGINLEEVMDYSRHKDVKVLMIYRDRERNVQGKLANLVSQNI